MQAQHTMSNWADGTSIRFMGVGWGDRPKPDHKSMGCWGRPTAHSASSLCTSLVNRLPRIPVPPGCGACVSLPLTLALTPTPPVTLPPPDPDPDHGTGPDP